ncbi:MAG: hypothetical protein QOD39_1107, partial [Mycobacterium sp.]|nr:hypothetical protein [Mycobacterium sp.]
AIAAASHNVFFIKVLRDVAHLLAAARRETDRVPGAAERASAEHVAILEAIKSRDADKAGAAMAAHLSSAMWAVDQVLHNSKLSDTPS